MQLLRDAYRGGDPGVQFDTHVVLAV